MQLQLHYTNFTTPQLQLHYATTATTSSSCGWGDRPGDHCNHCNHPKKTQLQPPFGPSVGLLYHPWFTTTKLPYMFPILKLPPPPCAILLVIYLASILTFFPPSLPALYLAFYLTFFLACVSGKSSDIHSSGFYLVYLQKFFVVEVRRGTLWSWACCSGPAGNTAI